MRLADLRDAGVDGVVGGCKCEDLEDKLLQDESRTLWCKAKKRCHNALDLSPPLRNLIVAAPAVVNSSEFILDKKKLQT